MAVCGKQGDLGGTKRRLVTGTLAEKSFRPIFCPYIATCRNPEPCTEFRQKHSTKQLE